MKAGYIWSMSQDDLLTILNRVAKGVSSPLEELSLLHETARINDNLSWYREDDSGNRIEIDEEEFLREAAKA